MSLNHEQVIKDFVKFIQDNDDESGEILMIIMGVLFAILKENYHPSDCMKLIHGAKYKAGLSIKYTGDFDPDWKCKPDCIAHEIMVEHLNCGTFLKD